MTGVLLSDRYLAPMTDADLDEVVAIEHVAYEFPWSRGNFEDSLRNGYLGVPAARDGFVDRLLRADARGRRDAPAEPRRRAGRAVRGRGLAAAARGRAHFARGRLDGVLLEVRPSIRARSICMSVSALTIGRRKNYYPAKHRSREDAIVMRLTLNKDEGDAHGMG